jgi:hypothetical protein
MPILINARVTAFDCERSCLNLALEHSPESPENLGKLTALDQNHEQQIFD